MHITEMTKALVQTYCLARGIKSIIWEAKEMFQVNYVIS